MKKLHSLTVLTVACLSATSVWAAPAAATKRGSKASGPTPSAATANAGSAAAPAASAGEAAMLQRLEQLSDEVKKLQSQLAEVKQQQAEQAAAKAQAAVAPVPAAPAAAVPVATTPTVNEPLANGPVINGPDAASGPAGEPATVLTGYGEVNYNHYSKDSSKDQADVRRLVLGVQHRFDAKTKLVTELEVEHSVTSADDAGEVAIEQAFIERQLNAKWAARAGLFLMPSGLLNENHEPTAFYGVERNFVETAIIPSTWREGGLQVVGNFDNGLTLQTGLSTGFDVSKWDSTDAETAESPLGAVHQELAQAHAKDPAAFFALNWRGVPGLLLGGSWFSGNGGQGQQAAVGNKLRVTLWDLHARYTVGGLDLSTLYARGTIGGTAAFNTINIGSGTGWYPIPKRFEGAYVQAAYKLWSYEDLSLAPFVRLERFNTAKAYADIGQGLTATPFQTERVWTWGANLNVGQNVVLKADWQRFKQNSDGQRFNLGLGWSY
jgi:hypothetical protein